MSTSKPAPKTDKAFDALCASLPDRTFERHADHVTVSKDGTSYDLPLSVLSDGFDARTYVLNVFRGIVTP